MRGLRVRERPSWRREQGKLTTRELGISAALNAPIPESRFGVFRM